MERRFVIFNLVDFLFVSSFNNLTRELEFDVINAALKFDDFASAEEFINDKKIKNVTVQFIYQ